MLTKSVIQAVLPAVKSVFPMGGTPYDFSMFRNNHISDLMTSTNSGGTYFDSNGDLQSSASNTPRVTYGLNGSFKGLLSETASTNLCLRSEELNTSPWNISGLTVTEGFSTINGISMCRVEGSTGRVRQTFSLTSGTTYTFSLYAIDNGDSSLELRIQNAAFTIVAQNNTNTTGSLARYDLTYTAVATETHYFVIDESGSGMDNLIGGVQIEAKPFASTYIPTEGSTVTRTVDDNQGALSDVYNEDEGTIYFEFICPPDNGGTQAVFRFDDGSFSNIIRVDVNPSSNLVTARIRSGGVDSLSQNIAATTGVTVGQKYRGAISWKANEFKAVLEGNSLVSSVSGSVPVGIDSFDISGGVGGGQALESTVSDFNLNRTSDGSAAMEAYAEG